MNFEFLNKISEGKIKEEKERHNDNNVFIKSIYAVFEDGTTVLIALIMLDTEI